MSKTTRRTLLREPYKRAGASDASDASSLDALLSVERSQSQKLAHMVADVTLRRTWEQCSDRVRRSPVGRSDAQFHLC